MSIYTMHKNKLFWLLQVTGWILFWILEFIFFDVFTLPTNEVLLFSLTHFIGFWLTVGLRLIYHRYYSRIKTISRLSVSIIMGSLIVGVLWYNIDVFVSYMFEPTQKFREIYIDLPLNLFLGRIFYRVIPIIGWSALYFVLKFWLDLQIEKEKSEKAVLLAQQARLQMLRYQLNPHFLFNALNSIRALIDEDSKAAREMIMELSEFLRYSLIFDGQPVKPLGEELDVIRHYFSIEKKRFEKKLETEFDIAAETTGVPVPSFILQPVVENAIKYGMRTSNLPLKIRISASISGGILDLSVINSGTWAANGKNDLNGSPESTGKGLDNVKQRLENMYGSDYSLTINKSDNQVEVRIEIPLKPVNSVK